MRLMLLGLFATLTGCAGQLDGIPLAPHGAPDAGLLTLASGRTLSIYPAELRFSGRGRYQWPDGRSYDGDWQNGVPHGRGTEIRPDGDRYSGGWESGLRQGLGELITDHDLYQGELKAGMRAGHGVAFSSDGIYQGEWQADHEDGFGELAGAYGSHYSGGWHNGERAGQGAYSGADGSAYQGEWLADRPHGFGIYRFPDGTVYEGSWKAGRQDGIGVRRSASGVVYEGGWVAARREGFGIELQPDGGRYEGEWVADKRQGNGRQTWPDGAIHDGTWELNRPLGPGSRNLPTAIDVQGAWTGDSISSGLLSLPSGETYAGPLLRAGDGSVSPRLLAWLLSMADEDPHAQLLAATVYLDFRDSDPTLARPLLERAAQAGLAEAHFRLGVLLLESASPDRVAGTTYLERASALGHPEAARVLGDLLAGFSAASRTVGTPRDEARALDFYTRALRAGNPLAAERLARLLVTASDPALRDPARAIEVLEWVAIERQHWGDLDTLAAAFAQTGDLQAAVDNEIAALTAASADVDSVGNSPEPGLRTLVPAASALINPDPEQPDRSAMLARLAEYQSLLDTLARQGASE